MDDVPITIVYIVNVYYFIKGIAMNETTEQELVKSKDDIIHDLECEIKELQATLQTKQSQVDGLNVVVHKARQENKSLRNHSKATLLIMSNAVKFAMYDIIEQYEFGDAVLGSVCKVFDKLDIKTLMRFLNKALVDDKNKQLQGGTGGRSN